MSRFERLSVLDELFLHLEGPNTHMHVGSAAIFAGPAPLYEELLAMVATRLPMVPRFRQKLAFVPLSAGRPVWVDYPLFNLEYHVRRASLRRAGKDDELERLVARVMSQQLDRSKPLWDILMVQGLAGDRFALISKAHHCLVDGVSGIDLMSHLLDSSPEQAAGSHKTWTPAPEPAPEELLAHALGERLASPQELVRTIRSALVDPVTASERLLGALKSLGAFASASMSAPASSLNRHIGPHRRFATLLVPLGAVKLVGDALGATVNDVVVAAVTGGLRRLLAGRGEDVTGLELRAMVPVSLRDGEERRALGNRVSTIWAPLPVYEADPLVRVKTVSGQMRRLKASGQVSGAQVLTRMWEHAPPPIVAQAARLVARQRAFNLVITNVPGPQIPLYAMGRRMEEVYPLVPLADNTTLGVALFSYDGTLAFGLLGDYDSAADLPVLADGIAESIAELVALTA